MRPFSRPLIVWVTGILLQVIYPSFVYILLFSLLLLFIFLFFQWIIARKITYVFSYDTRWMWGIVYCSLLFFLSVQKTACSQLEWKDEPKASVIRQWAKDRQSQLLSSLDSLQLSDQEKSVLATITIGYRKSMDREVRKRFSVAGVAHILAVSGFHVGVVCGFVSFILSFLPRSLLSKWIKYLFTILLLWLFVVVTGLSASAVRAALMLTIYLTGYLLRRNTDKYNILAASAFCMLVYEPLYLFDIGFQLSYTAVFSILYLQPRLKRTIEVRNPLLAYPWDCITVTVAAQVGTTFLCLYYFGQFSLVFLLANLPLTFLALLLIPAGIIWMLLPAGFPGYGYLQLAVEYLTGSMLWLVDLFSRISFSSLAFSFSFPLLLASYGVLFLSLLYIRTKRPVYLLGTLSLVLILSIGLLIEKIKQCRI